MAYFPTPENLTTFTALFNYSNSVAGNWLGNGILMAVYGAVLLYTINLSGHSSNRDDIFNGFIAAGFFVVILGIIFRLLGYVNDGIMYLCILAFALPLFLKYITQ